MVHHTKLSKTDPNYFEIFLNIANSSFTLLIKILKGFFYMNILGTIILKPVSGPGTVTSHIEPNNLTILIHMPYGPT